MRNTRLRIRAAGRRDMLKVRLMAKAEKASRDKAARIGGAV